MKRLLTVIVLVALSFGNVALAQKNVKLGHINSTELMKIMPGRDSAESKLQAEVEQLEAQLRDMQAEFEKKYNDFTERQNQMSDLIKQTKQNELRKMSANIEEFQQNAQQMLQTRQAELLQPMIDRAKKAIEDVAKENGYTYVFDSGVGALLYQQDSDDLMPLVKRKLGLSN